MGSEMCIRDSLKCVHEVLREFDIAAQALCWIPPDRVPYWLVGRAGRFAWCAACQVERAGEGLRV